MAPWSNTSVWWLGVLVAVIYVVFGVTMIQRRESFARHGARFHQRVASRAPWLYFGGLGKAYISEEHWNGLIVPLAIFIVALGVALGVVIALTT